MTLRLGRGCELPNDAVTQPMAILAMRGAGKSNAATVLVEEMYRQGLPWVVIDPKGDYWGMRSSADGKAAGLPVPIFGGLHGDVPLEPAAGAMMAELIVAENLTCILDVSEFDSKAAQMRFLTEFGERLFRLHGRHPQPRHVVMEEADEFIPQRVQAAQARCVGAWTKMVKQGRNRGLGCTIVSQRSAVVNKDALTQIGTLIALRSPSPQDRKAIEGWVEHHAIARELVASLSSLEDGEAWLWSPQWLKRTERITFRRRSTFDSGATPEMRSGRKVATMADIDLGRVQEEMAAVIERAEADDPVKLRRRIAELQHALEREQAKDYVPLERIVEKVVPVVPAGLVEGFALLRDTLAEVIAGLSATLEQADAHRNEGLAEMVRMEDAPPTVAEVRAVERPAPARPAAATAAPASPNGSVPGLSKAERSILSVLAQHPQGRTRKQVAMLSGYSVKGGAFANALGSLRSKGYLNRGEPVLATAAGVQIIDGHYEPLPQGPALLEHWNASLGRAERLILAACLEAWPEPLSREQLADATGYEAKGGGFANALGKLRTLELITRGAEIYADESLAREVLTDGSKESALGEQLRALAKWEREGGLLDMGPGTRLPEHIDALAAAADEQGSRLAECQQALSAVVEWASIRCCGVNAAARCAVCRAKERVLGSPEVRAASIWLRDAGGEGG